MSPEIQAAFALIGHEGQFRLPGGTAIYEAVMYDDATARSDRPRLSRLAVDSTGIRQIDRRVDWDQPIEVLRDYTAEYESEQEELRRPVQRG